LAAEGENDLSSEIHHGEHGGHGLQLPTPTAWPFVLALGIALMGAGMVTHWIISALGVAIVVPSVVGWFRQVLPHEAHEEVEVLPFEVEIVSRRQKVNRLSTDPQHRTLLPLETYTITAGLKGGIAGGIAMMAPALLYGLIRYHSIWYAINLLAAGGFVSWAGASDAFMAQFHWQGLLAASAIHGLSSVLVGLLYGAMLPMFARRPIIAAGFAAPLLWTGLLYTTLGVVSPILNQRIDWLWFVVSQVAFGLVAGYVVNLQIKVRTPQFQALPFAVRAGIHGAEEPPQ
jgi:hypothetical protein